MTGRVAKKRFHAEREGQQAQVRDARLGQERHPERRGYRDGEDGGGTEVLTHHDPAGSALVARALSEEQRQGW
jgi:hypothetical protein